MLYLTQELGKKNEQLLDDVHELNEDVKDRDFELEWRKNNPEVERRTSSLPIMHHKILMRRNKCSFGETNTNVTVIFNAYCGLMYSAQPDFSTTETDKC